MYFTANITNIRQTVIENIVKLLSCGSMHLGYKTYQCPTEGCEHNKHVTFGCKSRFCPTCGKRATDLLINKQLDILPNTNWQHITLTLPGILWSLFLRNHDLLNELPKIAAGIFQGLAADRGINPGIFTAIHTFGRDVKWNVHTHLSTTMGGMTDSQIWKDMRFRKRAVMTMWRTRVIKLLRAYRKEGLIDVTNALLVVQYNKKWIVHFAKVSDTAIVNASYLGRYLKRPPLSMSRLEHYDGYKVTFDFVNHKTGKHQKKELNTFQFIDRQTQHIHKKGFRVIRYYGLLANRVRGQLLPIVYKILEREKRITKYLGYSQLMVNSFKRGPLVCILCDSTLAFRGLSVGYNRTEMIGYHQELATRKLIPFK